MINKKILTTVVCFLFLTTFINAQEKYLTKTGKVNFFSEATLEDITADNDKVLSIIDAATGDIAIQIKIKNFEFKKKLMQEHFNENYLESDKYPKAIFKGKILDFDKINETSSECIVKGDLTIHGVTKKTEIKANFIRTAENIDVTGSFMVALEDYKIKIPKIVFMKIAENIKVSFNFNHKPYKK